MTTPVQPAAPATPPTPAPTQQTPPAQPPTPAQPPAQQQPAAVPPAPPAPPPVPTPPTWQPPAPQQASQDDDGQDISGLPKWAQKQITDLRAEAAKHRTGMRAETVLRHAYATAGQLGANPDALLGSTAFTQAAEQLDPKSAEFPVKLAEAIASTLQANPWMAAAPTAPRVPTTSGGQFPGAPGAPAPSLDQQIAEAQTAGDWPKVIALKRQRSAPPAQ